ncbi:MAG: hypothetical protein HC822_20620 [Oscillochloris sp.]|nr:hypothetical protein [Oscillochloris sp.]
MALGAEPRAAICRRMERGRSNPDPEMLQQQFVQFDAVFQ